MKGKTKFAERLNFLLSESGHNQKWLAEKFEVSGPSVGWWFRGSEPSYETLCGIAKLFNVSTDYLLGLDSSVEIAKRNADNLEKSKIIYTETIKSFINDLEEIEKALED